MTHTRLRLLAFLAFVSISPSTQAAILWGIGADDNTQDGEGDAVFNDPASFNGVSFNVSGVQETGLQALPGSPANTGGASGVGGRDIDDDYYFAGVYSTITDGGTYIPVGEVLNNESYYDRALTETDPNMRWHFNLPDTIVETDTFTFSIDFYSLDEATIDDNSSFDLTFWVNGSQIGEMQSHTDFDTAAVQSWDFTLDDLGGIDQVGPGFDHYVEVRSTTTGSARWANLDYVQLEVNPVADDPNLPLPTRVNFGQIEIGSEDVSQTLLLTNSGTAENLTITGISLSGNDADSFALTPPELPLILGPGAEAPIEITLSPGDLVGGLSAILTVTSNDVSEGTQSTQLIANIFKPFDGEGVFWSLGANDGNQDGNGDAVLNDPATFNGISYSVSGVRETGPNELPGNPANTGGAADDTERDIDDDYYFAGVYNTVTDGSGYTPVGVVPDSESYYDRALTNGDPNMRWHFNVPKSIGPNDLLTFSIDFYNLSEEFPENDSSYDMTFYVNGKQIGEMQSHSDSDLDAVQSWEFSLDDLGGTAQQGAGFDHYVEVKTQSTGSAQWASLDYVELAVAPGLSSELIISEFSVDPATKNVTFQFNADIGQSYLIERSTKMLPSGQPGGWIEIEDSLEATAEIMNFTDPAAATSNPKFFYRVRREE